MGQMGSGSQGWRISRRGLAFALALFAVLVQGLVARPQAFAPADPTAGLFGVICSSTGAVHLADDGATTPDPAAPDDHGHHDGCCLAACAAAMASAPVLASAWPAHPAPVATIVIDHLAATDAPPPSSTARRPYGARAPPLV